MSKRAAEPLSRQTLRSGASLGDRRSSPGLASRQATSVLGNRQLLQLQAGLRVQARLSVSQPDDPYEVEAERVADAVMLMSNQVLASPRAEPPQIQRLCAGCDEELNKRADSTSNSADGEIHGSDAIGADLEAEIRSLQGRGQALPTPVRGFMESSFGADFGGVRVHDNPQAHELARAVNAQAFTVGRDVVFGSGSFEPQTTQGQKLIAHELTHVVQQGVAVQRAEPAVNLDADRWHLENT